MSSLNFLNNHRRKSVHRRVHKIKVFILEVIYGARNGLLVALFNPGGTPHNGLAPIWEGSVRKGYLY